MKKGLAVLLVLVMCVPLGAALESDPADTDVRGDSAALWDDGSQVDPVTQAEPGVAFEDPMLNYLSTLDPDGPRFPRPPMAGVFEDGVEPRTVVLTRTDCVMLYEDPDEDDEWIPLPTQAQLDAGEVAPVSFENETQHTVHGKLFEKIVEDNTSYMDDIGIARVPIAITFDGEPVAMTFPETGNNTTMFDPFIDTGNGTFEFLLDVNKPAGRYEIELVFDGWPTSGQKIYQDLMYKAVVYVNHPSDIDVSVSPDSQVVGQPIQITGTIADDTGRPITKAGLQVRFDNVLLGPTSDGMYLDNVGVTGADFFDDFEEEETDWSTYTAPGRGVPNQWVRGGPEAGIGPTAPYSGSNLFGTILDGDYQRGAWSFLVTPRLNFSADEDYILSFYAWWSVYWDEDYCYVLGSVDGGNSWDEEHPLQFMGTTQIQTEWTYYEFNVSRYVGSDNVKFAFVFYAEDKTLDVRPDATFSYQYVLPMSSTADRHRVSVHFKGDLLFRPGMGYRDIDVKRICHFEFEQNASRKVGHRNEPIKLVAYLRDNMGDIPNINIRGHTYTYRVAVYWDKTYQNPIDPDTGKPIKDDPGELAGPPRTMIRDTGEVSVPGYVVDWDQTLGPANVTFRFGGEDYYTAVEMQDVYYVKADIYIDLPEKEELRAFRNKNVDITGNLRIVPEQSTQDQQVGDSVSGEFIKCKWGAKELGDLRTGLTGDFSKLFLVPSTHELGDVLVTFEYEGQSLYEAFTHYANYTVVSETFITLENQRVYKGMWVFINGTMKDDKNQPVANMPVYIIWKRAPEIGRATTKTDGTFTLQYYINYEDNVGNISVIARFKGTKIYLANETTSIYTVKVHTYLTRTSQNTAFIRGQQVQVTGKLYEDWGGFRGVEVYRETVSLLIDDILVKQRLTVFDGSVTFTAAIDPQVFKYGEVPLVLDFNGTDFYEPSRNVSSVVIRANSNIIFNEFRVQGDIFDPSIDVIQPDQDIYGRILLQDDNAQPIPNGNVSIYYKEEGLRARKRLIQTGITDQQGFFEFNWTFRIKTEGNKTFIAEYEGLAANTALKQGDLIILPTEAYYNTSYDVPEPEPWEPSIWVYIIGGGIAIGVGVFIVWGGAYARRRRQLRRMQRIIRRAADRLVAGNVYAATIFRAYREMARTLRAYGQLRRDSETFREFENAVREALPIDEENLDGFLTVLEEARYSEHEIGEGEKDRAIDALRGVQASIERILLTEEEAARVRAKVGGAGDVVEPEIIVAEEGGAPPTAKPPVPVPAEEPTPEEPTEKAPKGPEE